MDTMVATRGQTPRGDRCRASDPGRSHGHLRHARRPSAPAMNYLEAIAQGVRQAVPHDALAEEETADLFLAYAVLLLAKDGQVTREDVHNAWVAWMVGKGEEHESMRPFVE